MGSYENIVKLEEMRRRMEEADLPSAQKILDTMDIKKIKNISDLNLMAEVYTENERYDEAADLYLKIYDKNKTRKALYQLVEISIKRGNEKDAGNYLTEYEKLAPNDFYRYIFRYKIDKLKGETYEHLIETLEALKKEEYTEQWAYELAKLYYKAGKEKECIRECSDIILWFGEGSYVEKAKILRSYYSQGADKVKIMDEIKRRAEEVGSISEQTELNAVPESEQLNYEEDASSDKQLSDRNEDVVAPDYEREMETADLEDGLKKDIQNILSDEQEIAPLEQEQYTDVTKDTQKTADEEDADDLDQMSERDLAEQEVEETIYQLLEEDNADEDDKELNRIASEYQINPVELFGNFLHVESIKKQLLKSLVYILQEKTKTVLMIITGTKGSGKTTLAKDIALFLNKTGKLKSSKVAKISAVKLNSVDLATKSETLKDCCLVIEDASELKRNTIDSLMDLTVKLQGDIAVIFEEDKKNMNKLFRECPKLMDLLKNRIHLPQYTGEELLGFAYACLKQKDYKMNPKAETVLKNRIIQISKQSEPHSYLVNIYNLMESVMNAADLRTGKQLTSLASQGRLKDVEILSILPEDFKN
jgi:adenylate kinase family enzyme